MFSPWRLPHLDRIGQALATYESCRCRECRRKVLRVIDRYEAKK